MQTHSQFRLRSQLRTALLPGAIAAAILTSPQAGAWPFAWRQEVNSGDSSGQGRMIAIQADKSAALELFCGGNKLMRGFQPGGIDQTLPAFDYTPYASNFPVTWRIGHGDAGDVDGDGDIDLVRSSVLFYNNGNDNKYRLMVSLKNGESTWQTGWQRSINSLVVNSGYGNPIKLADLDRDGDLDLIECYNGVKVHWNPGDGNFGGTPKTIYAENAQYFDLAVLDCDNDGWLDVVAALDSTPARLVRLLNNGAGGFSATTAYSASDNWYLEQLEVCDIDGDGRDDLLFNVWDVGGNGSNLSWLPNAGSTFNAPVPIASTGPGRVIACFAIGDADEDGAADVVYETAGYPYSAASAIMLARHTAPTTFAAPVALKSDLMVAFRNLEIAGICIADGDQDGDNDIYFQGGGSILENTAIHRQAGVSALDRAGTNPSGATDLMVTDLNGDGEDDLVAASGGDKKILWYAGGASTLSGPISVSTGNRVPTSIAAGDFNGDHYMDLVYATTNEVRRLYSFNGGGVTWNEALLASMPGAVRVTSADADADGDLDVLGASASTGLVRWHRNNGDGSVWEPESVATGVIGVNCITTGQIFPGGRPEVVSVATNSFGAAERTHKYAGSWSATAYTVGTSDTSCAAVVANVIGDPAPEVIAATGENRVLLVSYNVEVGALSDRIHSLEAIDWNRDGRTDILCAWAGGVIVYINANPNGKEWTPVHLASRDSFQDAVPIDLNHDDLMDAAAVKSTGALVLFTNTSHEVSYTQTVQHPPGGAVKIAPGTDGAVIALNVTQHGRESILGQYPDDAAATPAAVTVRFYKAVASGSSWTAGGLMTSAEVQQAVESVNVEGLSVTTPAAMSGSNLILNTAAADLDNLATHVGEPRSIQIRVRLKPTAANASYSHFFVEHFADGLGIPTRFVALDAGNPSQSRTIRANPDGNYVRSLVEIDGLTSLEAWRKTNFGAPDGTGTRANNADYDKDGVPNIVEYATGTNPLVSEGMANAANGIWVFPPAAPTLPVQFRLRLSDAAMNDPKVKVTIQQTSTLDFWGTTASRTGGGAWTGLAPQNSTAGSGYTSHLFVTTIKPQSVRKYFLRLKVEELP